jgi:hypothetical protein
MWMLWLKFTVIVKRLLFGMDSKIAAFNIYKI